jgi:Ca-activated chloride channel homolog
MIEFFNQLHFLRPLWLLALVPLVPLILLLWRQRKSAGQWQHLIAPHLLPFLLEGKTVKTPGHYLWILLFAWILSVIALAGPSWKKAPVAVEKNDKALVILLDLSPSMLTEDIKPSRVIRARLKIADLLRERPDGQTALLVYAADAHVVTPLTDDAKTINNLLPMLSPKLMPAQGSNTEAAVTRAIKLLQDAGLQQGDLLLITDGVESVAQKTINDLLKQNPGIRLSILGVGGKEPAPIPSNNGGFVRDRSNNIVTSYLDADSLRRFAENNGGRYKTLTSDVNEIKIFTQLANMEMPGVSKKEPGQKSNRQFDQWTDEGHWLVFLLLPVIAYAFRRGVLFSLVLLPFLLSTPETTYAFGWDELWKNKDQRAYEKFQAEKAAEAAKEFTRPDWQASADYQAGNYADAATKFSKQDTASGHYNRGNALAKSGNLEEAIKAYDKALSLDSDLEDAKKNRKIVEDALKKQKEQSKDQNQNQKQDQKQDQEKNENQQNSKQENSEQQNQNQKQENQSQQQNQDQQSADPKQNSSQGQGSSAPSQAMNESNQSSEGQESQLNSHTSSSAGSPISQNMQSSSAESGEEKSEEQKAEDAKAIAEMQKDGLTEEERKNLEQWLRRVQDDPSGLLRRKFEYEYRKQQSEKYRGTWESPENEADERL